MKKMISLALFSMLLMVGCSDDTSENKFLANSQDSSPQTIIVTPTDSCGDGKLSINEVCDGSLFSVPDTCVGHGFDTGMIKCTSNCSLDFSDCKKDNSSQNNPVIDNPDQEEHIQNTQVCGNNIKEEGEDCDTQYSLGNCSQYGDFNKGEVFCSSKCTLNLSNCMKEVEPDPVCGNGIREAGEECDDGNMDNTDMCTNNCTVRKCGDNILSQDEECDGSLFTITSCSAFNSNYDTGSLKCTSTCKIDASNCSVSPKCGDGEINAPNEECDTYVGTHTCGDIYSQSTGEVLCIACKLDYSGCKEVCPTGRIFKPGQYTYGSLTFHIVDKYGTFYIVMDNKIGEFINDTTIQWTYSSVGDEGYYSYFTVGNCDCNSCSISFNNTSYLNQEEVKPVTSKSMQYSYPSVTDVPSYTISNIEIPESIRTKNIYYSCNYRNCDDKDTYYLNITDKEFYVYGGSDIYYRFYLIRDLGENTYLVRYSYGYPKQNGMGDKPYAVIHITETSRYRVCDNFNVKDKVVTILSWSRYRDTAIGKADFNSKDSFTYKYQVKYSRTSCDNPYDTDNLADIYLTEKDNRGKDLYKFSPRESYYGGRIYHNYCVKDDRSSLTTYNREEIINSKEDDVDSGYISTYRDNVLVFDGTYSRTYIDPISSFIPAMSDYYSGGTVEGEKYQYNAKAYKEIYGRYQFEIIFPNKSFMDSYLKVDGNYQDISLIPTYNQNSNYDGHRKKLNSIGLEGETIVLCKVNLEDESRECKDMELSFSTIALLHVNFKDKSYFEFPEFSGYCPR